MSEESKIIGRASAVEKTPNQSNEVSFWLAPEALVNPFDIVEAESYRGSKSYGLPARRRALSGRVRGKGEA